MAARTNREYGYWAGESEEDRHLLGFRVTAPIGIRARAADDETPTGPQRLAVVTARPPGIRVTESDDRRRIRSHEPEGVAAGQRIGSYSGSASPGGGSV